MRNLSVCFGIWLLTFVGDFGQGIQLSRKGRDLEEKANRAWDARDLEKARELYRQLSEQEPKYVLPHLRLAQIYEWGRQSDLVKQHYEAAVKLAPDSKDMLAAYQWLGKKAQEREDYRGAEGYWQKVLDILGGQKSNNLSKLAERQLESAKFALKALENPLNIHPRALSDTVNRLQLQFFPVLTADREKLIFTALDRGGNEDIFISTWEKGSWSVPVSISDNINTSGNEGTCTVSADGHTLVFTACNRADGLGSCDLYISYLRNGKWSGPENIGEPVNSRHWESQPSLSADGSVLYFASDRPGGAGKSDVWKSVKNEKGKWGEPFNLGAGINTPDDENAPFIHANGTTLFYASKGLPGMGGFDIFMADIAEGVFAKPVNLGYPINNNADQVGLFITADGKTAYYTEDRSEQGKGRSSRLYHFEIPEKLQELFVSSRYVKGRVLDSETQAPVRARIKLYDLATRQLVSEFASDESTGEFLAVVNKDSHYALYVESTGYLFKSMSFDVTDKDAAVRKDILVEKAKKDKAEVLTNVYFETGDFNLSEKSKLELDKLVAFLSENRNLSIEVSGHTDDVGSDDDNLKLSEKRAESVVGYLTDKGVASSRLHHKGYGESRPRVPNSSEENRSINRRIEWRIL